MLPGFDITPYQTWYGGRVGLGDVDADARADLLTGAGPDPVADATAMGFRYDGTGLSAITTFLPFSSAHGVNVVGGELGH